MYKVQMLRALVKQRLTAAAEEIFGLFERTIAEYEEELCRSKEENERQQKLLDAVFNPQLQLNRADIQRLSVVTDEVLPEQQEQSSSLDQEDPEPPHIKKEQEELWTSQQGERLQGLEEADITKFTFTPVPVKSEDDDEEKPQSSQLHQRLTELIKTEPDGEDCGGPEPARNSDLDRHPEPDTDYKTGESSEPETGHNDSRCSADEKPYSCPVCGKRYGARRYLKRHMKSHTGERPFSCLVCKKSFIHRGDLQKHVRIHTGEKPFNCSICGKGFSESGNLNKHMRTHQGDKPFTCSVCKKSFMQSGALQKHMRIHTGEKRFSCSGCDQRFTWLCQLGNVQCVCCQSSQHHQTQTEERGRASSQQLS